MTDRAKVAVESWVDWSKRTGAPLPCDQVVASVVEAFASDLRSDDGWYPIESLPEGRSVMLYWPHGEKGVGGIECAMVFKDGDQWSYWTHGGPNSGSDWEPRDNEKPTHWMPLPDHPRDQTIDGTSTRIAGEIGPR